MLGRYDYIVVSVPWWVRGCVAGVVKVDRCSVARRQFCVRYTRMSDIPPGGARPFIPATKSLKRLAEAVDDCRGCPLYKRATQGVFGEGRASSRILIVGEQPGDQEDLAGKPFVGPAGAVLDRALAAAGIPRADVFLTNAVK